MKELTENVESLLGKLGASEKAKSRLVVDLEDAQAEADKAHAASVAADKRTKALERQLEEAKITAAAADKDIADAHAATKAAQAEVRHSPLEQLLLAKC